MCLLFGKRLATLIWNNPQFHAGRVRERGGTMLASFRHLPVAWKGNPALPSMFSAGASKPKRSAHRASMVL